MLTFFKYFALSFFIWISSPLDSIALSVDSLKNLIQHESNAFKLYNLYNLLSDEYSNSSQLDSHRMCVRNMFNIAKRTGKDSLISNAYLNLSLNFNMSGDYASSLAQLNLALEYEKRCNSSVNLALLYKEIGICYKYMLSYILAKEFILKALTLSKSDESLNERIYAHLAETYLALQQTDSAFYYIQLANEYANENTDPYGFARSLFIFAKVYDAKGELALASTFYSTCHQFCLKHNFSMSLLNYELPYAQFLFHQKDLNQALSIAQFGYQKAYARKDFGYIKDITKTIKDIFLAQSNLDSAFKYGILYQANADSLIEIKKIFQDQNSNFQSYLLNQKKEIDNQIKISERNRITQYVFTFVVILSLLILLFILSYSAYINERHITYLGIFLMIMIFEFINLLLFPILNKTTEQSPIIMLSIMISIGAIIIPIHHKIEHWMIHLLRTKNKEQHLKRVKKTLEELN